MFLMCHKVHGYKNFSVVSQDKSIKARKKFNDSKLLRIR